MKSRAKDWLKQATEELRWAKDALSREQFALSCFLCQQSVEKALKAIAFNRGAELVRTHSVLEISRDLNLGDSFELGAKRLDQYYIATRYPDAFPSGAPYTFFTADQSQEAISFAEKFIKRAQDEFPGL